ncbi:MAG: hypothetical protein LBF84_01560 [Holosporales bacterium]|nr:hypothetical protein [Holosporales bacterium]
MSPYTPGIITDWSPVLGHEEFFLEEIDSYGELLDVDPSHFVATQSYYRDGNILVFPHLAACGVFGAENTPLVAPYLTDAYYNALSLVTGKTTRGPDYWNCGPETDAIVRRIGETWVRALKELCDNNPGDGSLDILLASHATSIQTQNFLARMFELCPEARLTEANFPGNSDRFRLEIVGGHDHGCFLYRMLIKNGRGNGKHLVVPFSAPGIYTQSFGLTIFNGPPNPLNAHIAAQVPQDPPAPEPEPEPEPAPEQAPPAHEDDVPEPVQDQPAPEPEPEPEQAPEQAPPAHEDDVLVPPVLVQAHAEDEELQPLDPEQPAFGERVWAQCRKHRTIIAAVGVAAVIACGVALYKYRTTVAEPPLE